MSDDPPYIKRFKALQRGEVREGDLEAIEAELYGASDRSRAVLLTAFVEAALSTFIHAHLREDFEDKDEHRLFGFESPLGTFSAQILVAHCLGWYGPDTRHDLNIIRELRNGFAHSRNSFTFETPEVAEVCQNLRAPDSPGSFIPSRYLATVTDDKLAEASDKNHPRTRFLSVCHTVANRLLSNSGKATGVLGIKLDLP